jgi:hypothetical protein
MGLIDQVGGIFDLFASGSIHGARRVAWQAAWGQERGEPSGIKV